MNPVYRIFISSRMLGEQAQAIRAAAARAIEAAQLQRPDVRLVDVSFYGRHAGAHSPVEVTRKAVASCDLFVLILWDEESFLDVTTGHTAISHEMAEAMNRTKPILLHMEETFQERTAEKLQRSTLPAGHRFSAELLYLLGMRQHDYQLGVECDTFHMEQVISDPAVFIRRMCEAIVRWVDEQTARRSSRQAEERIRLRLEGAFRTGALNSQETLLRKLIAHHEREVKRNRRPYERYRPTPLLLQLGWVLVDRGRVKSAGALARRAAELPQLVAGDAFHLAVLSAAIDVRSGLLDTAYASASHGLETIKAWASGAEPLGAGVPSFMVHKFCLSPVLINMASIAFFASRFGECQSWLDAARELEERYLDVEAIARIRVFKAQCRLSELESSGCLSGHAPEADAAIEDLAEISADSDKLTAAVLAVRAGLALYSCKPVNGRSILDMCCKAIGLCRRIGDFDTRGYALWKMGRVYASMGQGLRSWWAFRRAMTLHKEMGYVSRVRRIRADWEVVRTLCGAACRLRMGKEVTR